MAQILIIEDEAHIRDNLVRFLKLEGHTVAAAPDGLAGLEHLRSQTVDLVICDFMRGIMKSQITRSTGWLRKCSRPARPSGAAATV